MPPRIDPPPAGSTAHTYLGIEIGGTKLQIGVGSCDGVLREKVRLAVNREEGAAGIQSQIAHHAPLLLSRHEVRAVGIGFGGPVLWRSGHIACSHHVSGWGGFPLSDWLQEITGVPVFVENDANAAALGESLLGAGRGADPLLWMNAGSGIGGGLVVGGDLYHGAAPGEVEIGHLRLDRSGTITEEGASGWSIDAKIREAATRHPAGILAGMLREKGIERGETRILTDALEAGDPDAALLLNETADTLAYALSHAVHLLHPEVVVFGGGVSLLGEALRSRMEAALERWLMEAFRPGPRIVLASLGEDSVLLGALCLAHRRVNR
jgi:glucokinase